PRDACTLALHDALPIFGVALAALHVLVGVVLAGALHPLVLDALLLGQAQADAEPLCDLAQGALRRAHVAVRAEPVEALAGLVGRSEEHTSELQSRENLV